MSAPRPVRREQSFFLEYPALIATILGIAIAGGFLFALYEGTQGHHDDGGHGAPPPGAAPAGSGAARPAH